METMTSFYPVVMTTDAPAAARFFEEHLGFAPTFAADWYVSLRRDAAELAFLASDHDTIPAGFGVPARGVLLNVEVDDARAAYERLVADAGLPCVLALRDEPFGQRHFILVAPGDVLVDVIEPIEPSDDFRAAFS
ncbi:VOC family protein [Microbacterium atlanticum]|uniref:VOC family protein n=1 Tax=Microbacterium atlanticum TaxID=2782168 RepID=UPI001888AC98|nr:VOC family protein [Microbacterium atlanticum]